MSRPFVERTYPGEAPRPSVEVTRWENGNFVMAATPWGNKDSHKSLGECYLEFLSAGMADLEATSPFARLPTLSPLANSLRAATLYANEKVCKVCNQDSFMSACEALVMTFDHSEIAWIQVGQPHLFLIRNDQLIPLEVAVDLSVDYQMQTPLPGRLIGVERQLDVAVKSLVLQEKDRFVMLARSTLPSALFTLNVNKSSQEVMDSMFDTIVAAENKTPFWISILG